MYFTTSDGLYKTQGQQPYKVSDLMNPLWTGGASDYYTGGVIDDVTDISLANYDERIFMGFGSQYGQRVLVYEPRQEWFSIYDLNAKVLLGFDDQLYFGGEFIAKHGPSYPDDDGDAINYIHRSGWMDFNSPDVKVVRATKMWGAGATFYAMCCDFEVGSGHETLLQFGDEQQPQWNAVNGEQWNQSQWAVNAALSPKQDRTADSGTTFSSSLRGQAPFALHRKDHLVRQVRQPGVEQ